MFCLSILIQLLLFSSAAALAQTGEEDSSPTQTVKGRLLDEQSGSPLIGANVQVITADETYGAATDVEGYYKIEGVPLGRHTLRISYVGYQARIIPNVQVQGGKQTVVNASLTEDLESLDEVVVTSDQNQTKGEAENEMATVSARSFTVEETQRYAGSRNDPARMAANFAGVAAPNDSRNDIVIRGNAPTGLLWRLEGLDIPSPNHFGTFGTTGGPVSMLNNNVLANSDFFTGAFPAGYGNALAGAFDLDLRSGNRDEYEYVGQVGFNGFEAGAEGPLGQGSFLINGRYSTLGFFDAVGIPLGTGTAVPNYSDVTFKLDLPTQNAGRFEIFGLGGVSSINLFNSELLEDGGDAEDQFGQDGFDLANESRMGVAGMTHTIFLSENTSLKNTFGASTQQVEVRTDSLLVSEENSGYQVKGKVPYYRQDFTQNKYSWHGRLNHKLNARNTFQAGIIADHFAFDLTDSTYERELGGFRNLRQFEGGTELVQGYANWKHRFSGQLSMTAGIQGLYFNLNERSAVEPRLGFEYSLTEQHTFSLAAGVHHQLQPLPVYFIQTRVGEDEYVKTNQNLDYTRSIHYVAGYQFMPASDWRIKTEVYYQDIDNAGVERRPTSFSLLNAGADFGIPDEDSLTNGGTGYNYGLELTAEKFLTQGYYMLFTTSLYQSRYKGSDGVERNTAFNNQYVINFLGGKEWKLNASGQSIALDLKTTTAGGSPYTPIDVEASRRSNQTERLESEAFSERFDAYFRQDVKVTYRSEGNQISQEWSLDMQNVFNTENAFQRNWSNVEQRVKTTDQLGIFPVVQYRVLF